MAKLTKQQKRQKKLKIANKKKLTQLHQQNFLNKQQPALAPLMADYGDTESYISREEFKHALEQRLTKRLEKQSFDELTVYGSKLRFEMGLAIDGYPFEIPPGENEADYERLLSSDQYMSGYYDDVIDQAFAKALRENAEAEIA